MKSILAFAVFAVALNFIGVQGAAYFDEIKSEKVYGRRVLYCEYKGFRFLPYSKIKDYDDCAVCKCRRSGLSCFTTLPIVVSEIDPDSYCMPVNVGCKQLWVIRSEPWKKCPPKKIPPVSMVGK